MSGDIPYVMPWFDDAEMKHLRDVLDSTFVTESSKTEQFVTRVSEFIGSTYANPVFNGTMAIFCALKSVGIEKGDEVIVPDFTFIATANAVLLAGGKPVFVDVDPDTLCLDVDRIPNRVLETSEIILPVHLFGRMPPMDDLLAVAEEHDLTIVEDAAQALGVRFDGQHAGTFGDAGAFSFFGDKIITTGEGGLVVTDDKNVYEMSQRVRNHGRLESSRYSHDRIGWNLRITDLQAAVGLGQLDKLDEIIAHREWLWKEYTEGLQDRDEVTFLDVPDRVDPVYWRINIFVDDPERLSKDLDGEGIPTRRLFKPLHQQPCYDHLGDWSDDAYPGAIAAFKRGLSLPCHPKMDQDRTGRVIRVIQSYFQ